MKTKLTIVALLAFAAGGTCPSDIDNDGVVGVNDFLAVLAAWGPCPAPKLVDYCKDTSDFSFRLWSDNKLEVRNEDSSGCLSCAESWPPPLQWIELDAPAASRNAHPTAVVQHANSLSVAYSDGSVYRQQFSIVNAPGCDGDPKINHCVMTLDGWEVVP